MIATIRKDFIFGVLVISFAGGHDIMDNRYFDSHSNWPGIATVWNKNGLQWRPHF